ncbi:phage tail protein [Endozoicomonas sp. SM1973]|uniref:Phage tail protein n=1 Tax=Spartinivicinus marinus TaxID=2994442 RepID=A0A853IIN2_9GAMM|nr:phage tail protein [Spartinivicinus marinus]MCX4025103.1 phage tail protein [Spartinivicinus marinus]MCX4026945.1 phage tail protein [Spartinivicinus marinus]NYZ69894.1 phage tail protein [Spartinivicinus marinus]
MNQEFFSLLTKQGQARIINAQALGKTVKLTTLKVGDGGEDGGKETNPKETDTSLVRDKWQGPINHIFQHPDNDNWLVAETVIVEEDGNFYITEFGLYDEDDNLIVIGKYPKTYKPTLAQGSGSSLYVRVIFELSNTANVELKIDPAIVLASRQYVDDKWKTHLEADNPHPQYVKHSLYDNEKNYTGVPDEMGSRRHCVFQGIVYRTSFESSNNESPASGGDFEVFDLKTQDNVYFHFVTPFNIYQHDAMFLFHVLGFSYNSSRILNDHFAGYCYAPNRELIKTTSEGKSAKAIYTDSQGNVIFSLFIPNTYFTTVTVDFVRVGTGTTLNRGDIKCVLSLKEKIEYTR